jgi:AraC family transcriptional regulator
MSEPPVSAESHVIDFSSPIADSALSYRRRIEFGDITLARSALLPNSGIYIGAEQVIVARHCGPAVRLEWRSPDSDALHAKAIVRGTIHIKSAGERFWQRWVLPADVLVIAFERNFFANLSSEAAGTNIELTGELGVNDRKLGELTALFGQELLDDGANGRFYVENLGAALVGYLVQRRTSRPAAVAPPSAGLAPARLRRVIDYIDAHLTDDLGLTELSRISGLNPHYFAHAFKATTGMPPHRFIIERRVDKARFLLEDKQQSIAEIALASGFATQSHFTQHFRRVVGTTPAKFRRDL